MGAHAANFASPSTYAANSPTARAARAWTDASSLPVPSAPTPPARQASIFPLKKPRAACTAEDSTSLAARGPPLGEASLGLGATAEGAGEAVPSEAAGVAAESRAWSKGQRSSHACATAPNTAPAAPAAALAPAPRGVPCQAFSAVSRNTVVAMDAGSSNRPMPAKTSLQARKSVAEFRSKANLVRRRAWPRRLSSSCPSCSSFLEYSGSIRKASKTPFSEDNWVSAAGRLLECTIWSQSRTFLSHEPTSRRAL
mmetsp:Transcript_2909/g.9000  ORF Transcript_2909/g.9000 Transcript_2909/m.9000 type:complete len:254 (-) Transcript_2909:490-1251(-)